MLLLTNEVNSTVNFREYDDGKLKLRESYFARFLLIDGQEKNLYTQLSS
jgi:hypothetical protein